MSIIGFINKIEHKFAWGFLSVLIAVVVGVFTIYPLFHEEKPSISIQILNEANVLDVHEPVENLSVLFQGEDIQKNNLNLRILTIRILNDGQQDILQNYYDTNDIWGLKIQNGDIIESRLVDSNADYIKENLKPNVIIEKNIIQFSKIIFEQGKYFVLEILVLHNKELMPSVTSIGKIAGIDEVTVIKNISSDEQKSYFSRMIEGDVGVHFARIGLYLAFLYAAVLPLVLIIMGISTFIEKTTKNNRKNKIKKYLNQRIVEKTSIEGKVIDTYVERGTKTLARIQRIFLDENRLKTGIMNIKKLLDIFRAAQSQISDEKLFRDFKRAFYQGNIDEQILKKIYEEGFVNIDSQENITVNEEYKQSIYKLLGFLDS